MNTKPKTHYRIRNAGVLCGLTVHGFDGWFVQNGTTGANETPNILRNLLPESSNFQGTRRVSERQAKVLAMIANNPAKTIDLANELRRKLRHV